MWPLNLIRVSWLSMGRDFFTGARETYQGLHHWRKQHPLSPNHELAIVTQEGGPHESPHITVMRYLMQVTIAAVSSWACQLCRVQKTSFCYPSFCPLAHMFFLPLDNVSWDLGEPIQLFHLERSISTIACSWFFGQFYISAWATTCSRTSFSNEGLVHH